MTQEGIERQTKPFGKEMVSWTYQQVVKTALITTYYLFGFTSLLSGHFSTRVSAELMAMLRSGI
jgi:hypothetical protein